MAKAAPKTRNSDGRKSGKAWKKSHNAPVKTLTPEQQERKAQKDAERERKRTVSHQRGSYVTMPNFDWEWAAETMQGRHTSTRRFRTVDACMAQQRWGRNDEAPLVTESNPEAKPRKAGKK